MILMKYFMIFIKNPRLQSYFLNPNDPNEILYDFYQKSKTIVLPFEFKWS